MSGWNPLPDDIVHSTIWQESGDVCKVWISMISMSDRNGIVSASVPGLAGVAKVSVAVVEDALKKFMGPDKFSRSKNDEGRRVREVEGGWLLINHAKYRKLARSSDQSNANRQARHRAKSKGKPKTTDDVTLRNVTDRYLTLRAVTGCNSPQNSPSKVVSGATNETTLEPNTSPVIDDVTLRNVTVTLRNDLSPSLSPKERERSDARAPAPPEAKREPEAARLGSSPKEQAAQAPLLAPVGLDSIIPVLESAPLDKAQQRLVLRHLASKHSAGGVPASELCEILGTAVTKASMDLERTSAEIGKHIIACIDAAVRARRSVPGGAFAGRQRSLLDGPGYEPLALGESRFAT